MKAMRKFWTPCAVITLALIASPAVSGQEGGAAAGVPSERISSFRADFNKVFDSYDGVFRKLGHARGLWLIAAARESLRAMSDDQLAKLFEKGNVADLTAAVQAAAKLESLTPNRGSEMPRVTDTPGFPGAPPILTQCDNIVHTPGFTFGALVAWQILRGVFVTTEHVCQQVLVVAGEGGNTSTACIIPAIAVDAAAIPFELAEFCSGEEDTSLAQGSYDRLEHIHDDIEAARAQIILEMRSLSCDLERLMHTPEGQRQSSVVECKEQPYYPYDFPIHYPHP
jgi:hypothetical protein